MNELLRISVVAPLYNEAGNVQPLVRRILEAMPSPPYQVEVLLVDDGSTDETWPEIVLAQEAHAQVKGVRHVLRQGQSAALFTGFRASHCDVIATLDGDLQNDPADLPRLLRELNDSDMLCGVRVSRADGWKRQFSSRLARWARKTLLRVDFRDSGCNLRVFRRAVLESIPAFRGVHRFMPILAHNAGAVVKEIPVAHHPRGSGRSKYGVWNRLGCGLLDLLMLAIFVRRQLKGDFQHLEGSLTRGTAEPDAGTCVARTETRENSDPPRLRLSA